MPEYIKYKLLSQVWDEINVRKYQSGNRQMHNSDKMVTSDIQDVEKTQHNIQLYVGHHYTQINTNNVKTGGKDEQKIIFM